MSKYNLDFHCGCSTQLYDKKTQVGQDKYEYNPFEQPEKGKK